MALPCGTTGSLVRFFDPARLVGCSQSSSLMPLHSMNNSNHSEGTFERLRYLLGGDRPSQTARLTLSPTTISGAGPSQHGWGHRRQPPRKLATLQRLLPILYKLCRISISGYSKAPDYPSCFTVTCIFTGTMISPSL